MTPQIIDEQWQDFKDAVELEQTHVVQQQEMKRAFFAGSIGVLNVIIEEMEKDAPDITLISRLHEEIQAFADAVLEGRA